MNKTIKSALLATTFGGAVCVGGMAFAQEDVIRMGGVVSISGSGASIGNVAELGWRIAVDEINAAGGVLGKQIQLVLADSMTDPTHAVSETRRLIENVGIGECPAFCVSLNWSMLPKGSTDDDNFQRTAGRVAEGLQAA